MVGDHNLPNFQWLPTVNGFFPSLVNLCKIYSEFLSKLSFFNLFQFNNVYHPGLLIYFPITVNKPIDYNLCMYNFFNCNYAEITFTLASIDWINLLKDLCVNQAVNLFYCIIYKIIDIFVPKIIKHHSNYPSWFSRNLKELIFK